jgi:hypothetical protein
MRLCTRVIGRLIGVILDTILGPSEDTEYVSRTAPNSAADDR